jgi:hypothetical protein
VGEALQNASPGDDRASAAEEGPISAGEARRAADADNSSTSQSDVEVIIGGIPDAHDISVMRWTTLWRSRARPPRLPRLRAGDAAGPGGAPGVAALTCRGTSAVVRAIPARLLVEDDLDRPPPRGTGSQQREVLYSTDRVTPVRSSFAPPATKARHADGPAIEFVCRQSPVCELKLSVPETAPRAQRPRGPRELSRATRRDRHLASQRLRRQRRPEMPPPSRSRNRPRTGG